MKRYELMVIVTPDIGGDALNKRLDAIREIITSNKGEIFLEDLWGMRGLAYPIKKQEQGFYVIFYFTLDSEFLTELDTTLRLENEVLRHLLVALPEGYEPITMEAKAAKDAEEMAEKEEASTEKPKKTTRKKEVVEEEKVEKKEKETKKTDPSPSLEEVDKKLDDVLDNPDLNF